VKNNGARVVWAEISPQRRRDLEAVGYSEKNWDVALLPMQTKPPATRNFSVAMVILMIFGGCMSNVYTLEVLTVADKGCGNLVTFSHMVTVAGIAFFENIDWETWRLQERKIGLKFYVRLVLMFFVVQTVNNKAFAFDISLPLHMVFRSGSLMASMLIGWLYLGRNYGRTMVSGVLLATVGIFVATWASQPAAEKKQVSQDGQLSWCIGVAMLVFVLFMSAFMGAMQEKTYAQLGLRKGDVPWQENLFWTHLLSIPVFFVVMPDVSRHIVVFNSCEPWRVSLFAAVPWPWLVLLLNVLTQYICIRGVYIMVGVTDALSCTLILNVRKLSSLLLSIYFFQHPFTQLHVLGVLFVAAGTILYTYGQMNKPVLKDKTH